MVPGETRSVRKYRGKPVEKDTGGTRKKNTGGITREKEERLEVT